MKKHDDIQDHFDTWWAREVIAGIGIRDQGDLNITRAVAEAAYRSSWHASRRVQRLAIRKRKKEEA